MGKNGVTFLGLWWAEFHAEKEMGAKLVGLLGSAAAPSFTAKNNAAIENKKEQ